MAETLMQRVVEALPFLDDIAEDVQPKVQEAVAAGGTTARNVLDGVWLEAPLHPALTDVPVGCWTAALVFDGLDVATGKEPVRHAADVSLILRASGRRNAGRLTFLTGYSISGMAAHLGGELSYHYGLRVDRNVFQEAGPNEFVPVLDESELPQNDLRRVEVEGVGVLLSRSSAGEVCAIAATCNHFSGPLEEGDREGDTVVCPLHNSRFDLCSGEVIDGPAVFPQSRYETRVRDGNIEVKAAAENVQKKVR